VAEAEVFEGAPGFREYAEAQMVQQAKLFEAKLEQHSALYRWILAARLSINGGVAIAVLSAAGIDGRASLISLALFSVGVVSAIIAAEFDQKALEKSFHVDADALGFWSKAAATGNFDATRLSEISQKAVVAAARNLPGKVAGWISLGTFICGVTVIGLSLALCPGICLICGAS